MASRRRFVLKNLSSFWAAGWSRLASANSNPRMAAPVALGSTLGIAEAASASGMSVLIIDLDPQANASSGLGVWNATPSIDDVLAEARAGSATEAICRSHWPDDGPRPDLVPGSHLLAGREALLAADPVGAQDRLRLSMAGVNHDLVLIDCPPSLGLLCINGLFAAERALIVTEPAAWAADGVDLMHNTVERVAGRLGAPRLAGVIVNRVGRTRDNRYWCEQLQDRFGELVLPQIQLRAAIAEASGQSTCLRSLGKRPGAAEAAGQFDELWNSLNEAQTADLGSGGLPPSAEHSAPDTIDL